MGIEITTFKQVMRRFATGVMVLTVPGGAGMHAVTVNAVTSLSLHPTLVLVCIENNAQSHGFVHAAGLFALNLLSASQQELGHRFAYDREARSHPGDYVKGHIGQTGALIMEGTLGFMECRVTDEYAGGDHTIFIGEVVDGQVSDPAEGPLLYYEGDFRNLRPVDNTTHPTAER